MEYYPPLHSDIEVIYEDDSILAVNKPAGLLTTPGRGENKQDCLVSRAQLSHPDVLVVHRLDMDTSGLILFARNKTQQALLSQLFAQREIAKTYQAICYGVVEQDEGTIELPLITDWPNRPKQKVDHEQGKVALTRFSVTERNVSCAQTRLALYPLTGRSHQLRVHLQSIGHPIVGDRLYAEPHIQQEHTRLMLHASNLQFTHPVTQKMLDLSCSPPF